MKFSDVESAKLFLVEVGKFDQVSSVGANYTPDQGTIEAFIKGRESIVPKMKSFARSQASKDSWRKNRYKYMKGIRGFHKSTDGKKFHRALGRHLATRLTGKNHGYASHAEKFEALKGISSLRTHLYIDTTYYRPLADQVMYDLYLDEAVMATINEEKRVFSDSTEFDERDVDILIRSVEPRALITEYCSVTGIPFKEEYLENFEALESSEDKGYIEILKESVRHDC